MEAELAALRAQALERDLSVMPDPDGPAAPLNFASNDYLGLSRSPMVLEAAAAALRRWGAGSGASRLVTGTWSCHQALEARLARLKQMPAARVFGSGYLAGLGAVSALVGRRDLVLADRLAHACLLDGAVLGRATVRRFRHNDAQHLADCLKQCPAGSRVLVVTESVFGMDGDLAPLRDIAAAARGHDALLLVDEAHATGVWGPGGSGLTGEWGLQSEVTAAMGTLSKALGGYGGFVAGSELLARWLTNRARPFVFSTAIPPASVGAALGALDWLETHPGAGAELLRRAAAFRARLQAAGFDTGQSQSQIVPVLVGAAGPAVALARRARAEGVLAAAIRPPTVPPGTARLRLSVTLAHSDADCTRAADVLEAAARAEGIL